MGELEPQGPANDPNWRTRFGLGPRRPDGLKNDYEPNNRVGMSPKAKAYVDAVKPKPFTPPRVYFDHFGIRIEKRLHPRYSATEYQLHISAPWIRTVVTNIPWRPITYRPRLVLAVGTIPQAWLGWHARGAIDRQWVNPKGDWI